MLVGCTADGDEQLGADTTEIPSSTLGAEDVVLAPPPALEDAPFDVRPDPATAGSRVEINYGDSLGRSGYYFLHQWTQDGWSEPTHLIETDGNGSPRIFVAGVDDFEIEDYGGGPSPEMAPLPDVAPGFWMLCETSNPETWCVSFEIAG